MFNGTAPAPEARPYPMRELISLCERYGNRRRSGVADASMWDHPAVSKREPPKLMPQVRSVAGGRASYKTRPPACPPYTATLMTSAPTRTPFRRAR
jgi:hypothetical protein